MRFYIPDKAAILSENMDDHRQRFFCLSCNRTSVYFPDGNKWAYGCGCFLVRPERDDNGLR